MLQETHLRGRAQHAEHQAADLLAPPPAGKPSKGEAPRHLPAPLNEGQSTLQRLQLALQTHVRLLFNFTA